ncbi:MAG TPA: [protein-PII] uridylyltransferase [Acidimicrobiales bacterium]|nr:[protein-PII] uridylyltransferase [Acidimicrobiales bacterium]
MAAVEGVGRAFCRAWVDALDAWFSEAIQAQGGVAVLALGGYGRRELCPGSDVDVLLLHKPKVGADEIATSLWYPLWDAGLKLGNAVRTQKQALSLAAEDTPSATALLGARVVAGDSELGEELLAKAADQWRKRPRRAVQALSDDALKRHHRYGDVAFLLEPDLKSGRGGLRDAHSVDWLTAADARLRDASGMAELEDAKWIQVDARVELHRRAMKGGDRLVLQEQDTVAEALGYPDADDLMRAISAAARTIAWSLDEVLRRAQTGPAARASADRPIGEGVVLRDGEIALTAAAELADPSLTLRAAAAAASLDMPLARGSLLRLAAEAPSLPDPWPPAARQALVRLLGFGRASIVAIEALDRHGLFSRLLPEWESVRHLPQRNSYHRFTVDRHLCEAAAQAAGLSRSVARPDLLLIGALLHDIGKGFPGDHTVVGMEVVARIASRMGFADQDTATLVAMVEHHLLLPDVATRRDLEDPATAEAVAKAVGKRELLELLAALTEADSLATGPQAWSQWKAGLVRDLVARAGAVLDGNSGGVAQPDSWVTADHHRMMELGGLAVVAGDGQVRVAAPDRPGVFARVSGALALHGLDVLAAAAASSEDGTMAIEEFRVESTMGREPDWAAVSADVERAVAGRIALEARIEERARTYRSTRPRSAAPAAPTVSFDLDASEASTVVEVRASDGVAVLYRITKALAECNLDIRSAKVQTLGHEVVDTFYVRDADGTKPVDTEHLAEAERAILAALA